MPLNRSREPFSSPDWIYELKYDGFRALAEIEYGRCRLISRNGNAFATFQVALTIGKLFSDSRIVLDGEIVGLDKRGRPHFNDLANPTLKDVESAKRCSASPARLFIRRNTQSLRGRFAASSENERRPNTCPAVATPN